MEGRGAHLAAEPIREQGLVLRDVLVPEKDVPAEFYIPAEHLPRWEYLKNRKKERHQAETGLPTTTMRVPVAFPEPLDQPSRTILTGEGGAAPHGPSMS